MLRTLLLLFAIASLASAPRVSFAQVVPKEKKTGKVAGQNQAKKAAERKKAAEEQLAAEQKAAAELAAAQLVAEQKLRDEAAGREKVRLETEAADAAAVRKIEACENTCAREAREFMKRINAEADRIDELIEKNPGNGSGRNFLREKIHHEQNMSDWRQTRCMENCS